ncbi:MAG: hypothetical protein V4717_18220 [Bacteroidota bacterium]
MPFPKLPGILILFCLACGSKKAPQQPDISFDKSKWQQKIDGKSNYRRQMVNDLVNNHSWTGVSKDSLVSLLGEPDDIENDINYLYYYEKEPIAGGIMFSHKAVTFELQPGGSKVKQAVFSKGAEWGN